MSGEPVELLGGDGDFEDVVDGVGVDVDGADDQMGAEDEVFASRRYCACAGACFPD